MRLRPSILYVVLFCSIVNLAPADPLPPTTDSTKNGRSPADELRRIEAMICEYAEDFDNDRSCETMLFEFVELTSQLTLFEAQFDIAPEQCPGWTAVAQAAARLLPLVQAETRGTKYYRKNSAELIAVVLLDLSGKPVAACSAMRTIVAGGRCGNWHGTVENSKKLISSAWHHRRGQHEQAVTELEFPIETTLQPLPRPLQLTRTAHLYEKTGRQQEAVPRYLETIDLYPDTVAARCARRRLQQVGAYRQPTAALVQAHFDEHEADVIVAMGKHRFPSSHAFLTKGLAQGGDAAYLYARALGFLGRPGAIPLLEGQLATPQTRSGIEAAIALARLGRPWHLVHLVDYAKESPYISQANVHRRLCRLAGSSPPLNKADRTNKETFYHTWCIHLESLAPKAETKKRSWLLDQF